MNHGAGAGAGMFTLHRPMLTKCSADECASAVLFHYTDRCELALARDQVKYL